MTEARKRTGLPGPPPSSTAPTREAGAGTAGVCSLSGVVGGVLSWHRNQRSVRERDRGQRAKQGWSRRETLGLHQDANITMATGKGPTQARGDTGLTLLGAPIRRCPLLSPPTRPTPSPQDEQGNHEECAWTALWRHVTRGTGPGRVSLPTWRRRDVLLPVARGLRGTPGARVLAAALSGVQDML